MISVTTSSRPLGVLISPSPSATIFVALVLGIFFCACGGAEVTPTSAEVAPTQAGTESPRPTTEPPRPTATKIAVPTPSGSSETDRLALISLYHATGGSNWTDSTNWLSDAPLDQWYGVTTGTNGLVAYLSLKDNELSGELPPELGSLTSLRGLLLGNNQIAGEIPPALGGLHELEVLELWVNRLEGAIPPELGSLEELERLMLSRNRLRGQIPPEIGDLSNLTTLNLAGNMLVGELPSQLDRLLNLEVLLLDRNQFSGHLPTDLGNLGQLAVVGLKDNSSEGCVPDILHDASQGWSMPVCAVADHPADREALVAFYNASSQGGHRNRAEGCLSDSPLGEWEGVSTNSEGRVIRLDLSKLKLSGDAWAGQLPPELGNLERLVVLNIEDRQTGLPVSQERVPRTRQFGGSEST